MDQHENDSKDELKVEDVENNNGKLTTNHYWYYRSNSMKFTFIHPARQRFNSLFFQFKFCSKPRNGNNFISTDLFCYHAKSHQRILKRALKFIKLSLF